MTRPPRKLSAIMKQIAQLPLRRPRKAPSSEAAHVSLLLAHVAWNESVGLDNRRDGCRHAWETIEAENPELWCELKSKDVNALIDELIEYKKTHYSDDRRRILVCGFLVDKIHVEWLPPAAPGVDSKWEMELYGLVRTGEGEKAIRFLQETKHLTRQAAAKCVAVIAAQLGVSWPPKNRSLKRKRRPRILAIRSEGSGIAHLSAPEIPQFCSAPASHDPFSPPPKTMRLSAPIHSVNR
jgi:hypothetical protein